MITKQCFVKGTNHPVTKYLIYTLFSQLDEGTDFSFNTLKFTGSFLCRITTVRLLAILIRSCCPHLRIFVTYYGLLCCQRSNPQHNATVPSLYVGLDGAFLDGSRRISTHEIPFMLWPLGQSDTLSVADYEDSSHNVVAYRLSDSVQPLRSTVTGQLSHGVEK